MITGLPPYLPPVVEGVICACREAVYRVYTGMEDSEAAIAEKEAAQLGAIFIDARLSPFIICQCGRVLDFSISQSSLMVN